MRRHNITMKTPISTQCHNVTNIMLTLIAVLCDSLCSNFGFLETSLVEYIDVLQTPFSRNHPTVLLNTVPHVTSGGSRIFVYREGDIVKQPMKKGSFVPKNVPGVGWVGWVMQGGGVCHAGWSGVGCVMQGWGGVGHAGGWGVSCRGWRWGVMQGWVGGSCRGRVGSVGHAGVRWGGVGCVMQGGVGWGVSCRGGVCHVGVGWGVSCRGGVGHVEVGWVGCHAGGVGCVMQGCGGVGWVM